MSGQGKNEGDAARTTSTPRARSGSQWGDGVGTAYDGSYSASSNRTNSSNSSAESQVEPEGSDPPPQQDGMGDTGFWSSMKMGMEVGDGTQT